MGRIHGNLEKNVFGTSDMEAAKLKEEKDPAKKDRRRYRD